MSPEQHRQKALKIERSLAKLMPELVEIRIEAAMLAGTHWLNAALHHLGANSAESDVMPALGGRRAPPFAGPFVRAGPAHPKGERRLRGLPLKLQSDSARRAGESGCLSVKPRSAQTASAAM